MSYCVLEVVYRKVIREKFRGVFVVPSGEYVRLTPPPKQVSDERNDITYYSLLRFCELLSAANPTALEMLYLPRQ